jgi:hypothetical protein
MTQWQHVVDERRVPQVPVGTNHRCVRIQEKNAIDGVAASSLHSNVEREQRALVQEPPGPGSRERDAP